jgi:hypothetical protein
MGDLQCSGILPDSGRRLKLAFNSPEVGTDTDLGEIHACQLKV